MNLEDFKYLAQGIQAVAIAIAAISGGIWAIFKLYSSKELDKSRADALKAKREIELRQYLEGNFDIEIGEVLDNHSVPVLIEVVIENNSSEIHTLDWDGFPLKIAQLEFDHEKIGSKYKFTPVAHIKDSKINPLRSKSYWRNTTTSTLLPRSKYKMAFFWECKKAGVYLLCVSAPASSSMVKYLHENDTDNGLNIAKEKFSKQLENYDHNFNFSATKIIQVPNKAFQRTSR